MYVRIDGKRGQTTVDFIVWQYGRFHRMALRTILSYGPTVCFTHSERNRIPTICTAVTARTMCLNFLYGEKNSDVMTAADGNKGSTIKL